MRDSEVRGLILNELYPIRHTNPHAAIPADVPALAALEPSTLYGVLRQLRDKGLIEFTPLSGGDNMFGRGKITAYGVDVIENNTPSPIAISIDNSVTVHGSHGVQIGGQGNVMNVSMDVEKMSTFIDSANASVAEKTEAKGMLKQLFENPLVKSAIEWWTKSPLGS